MTRMTPSEAFVETLVANGVDTIFGIMGAAFMDAMDIFAPAGIELVPVVHEQGAAHMADGYARVSRSPRCRHRPERARHLQLRHRDRRGLLGSQPGRDRHARRPARWASASVASRRPTSCRCSRSSRSTRVMSTTRTGWPRSRLAASIGPCRRSVRPSSTSRATVSTATSTSRSPSRCVLDRGPGGETFARRGRRPAVAAPSSR